MSCISRLLWARVKCWITHLSFLRYCLQRLDQIMESLLLLYILLYWWCIRPLLPSILSRIRGSVTDNNGFWIRWLDLLALLYNYYQLWQLTINGCLSPYRTTSVHSSSVTNNHCSHTELCYESESYVTTDGQPASLSWNKAPIWVLRPDLDYCLTVTGLLLWGAVSDERTGLPFAIATGPRQRSHFWVRVP
jgi:hypothetical protein